MRLLCSGYPYKFQKKIIDGYMFSFVSTGGARRAAKAIPPGGDRGRPGLLRLGLVTANIQCIAAWRSHASAQRAIYSQVVILT